MIRKRHPLRCGFLLSAAVALSNFSAPLAAQPAAERRVESENLDVTMRLLPEGATRPDAVTKVIELPEAIRARSAHSGDARPRPDPTIEESLRAAALQEGRGRADPPDVGTVAASSGRGAVMSSSAASEATRDAAEAGREAAEAGRNAAESGREAADAGRNAAEASREAVEASRDAAEASRDAIAAPHGDAAALRDTFDAAREASRELANDGREIRESVSRGRPGHADRPGSGEGAAVRGEIDLLERNARPDRELWPNRAERPDRDILLDRVGHPERITRPDDRGVGGRP